MAVSPFDSDMTSALFGDEEVAALFSDEAEIAAMIAFEAALARVEAALSIIPPDAGSEIDRVLKSATVPASDLRDGFASAGVSVPALVKALRTRVGGSAGPYVHWGATSQDVIDTALILRIRTAIEIMERRLDHLIRDLATCASAHARTMMAARTRTQIATPTTFGLRVAGWIAPLLRCKERLHELRPRLLVVQLGGASGTLGVFGDRGIAVTEALAAELNLGMPPKPWHSERDTLVEFAGWLSLLTGALGKMGADLMILGRSEIAEVKAGAGGGSSTMPQKSNPVASETLVSLARFNAVQVGGAHQALLHAEERDSSVWSLEWMILPQMVVAAGAALRHAQALALSLDVDAQRMRDNCLIGGGAALAEAASFKLAEHMPLPDAQALVKQAISQANREQRDLTDLLVEMTSRDIDWTGFADPSSHVGQAEDLIERVLRDISSDHHGDRD